MIVYAWILGGLWIISMACVPFAVGTTRTVGDATVNILYHIASLTFVGIFLAVHYLGGN